jgi:hypothetical protein
LSPFKKLWKEIDKLAEKYIPVIEPSSKFAKGVNFVKEIIQTFYIIVIPLDVGFGIDMLTNIFL